MYVLNSEILIGDFRFSGVHEVTITKSIHSIYESATIKLPTIASITRNEKVESGRRITASLIKVGDPVSIMLGYNGDLKNEFKGFVNELKLDKPLEVCCEGNSWLLRKNRSILTQRINAVEKILSAATENTEYQIETSGDLKFKVLSTIAYDSCGFDILNELQNSTDNNISIFFLKSGVLWGGLLYSMIAKGAAIEGAQTVEYRLGYNTTGKNKLKPHGLNVNYGTVEYTRKTSSGELASSSSKLNTSSRRVYKKVLTQVQDNNALKLLSEEKAFNEGYSGQEGTIETFLVPYVSTGDLAKISSREYPEYDGTYLVEGTHVTFGINGARRVVEIGPRLGFSKTS
jgi:hypothetical protein